MRITGLLLLATIEIIIVLAMIRPLLWSRGRNAAEHAQLASY